MRRDETATVINERDRSHVIVTGKLRALQFSNDTYAGRDNVPLDLLSVR